MTWQDVTDEYGALLHNADAGDAPANLGRRFCLEQLINPNDYTDWFRKAVNNILTHNKMFIRHPVQWNDPKDFSRDQTEPLVLAYLLAPGWIWLRDIIWNNLKSNCYRYQNSDWLVPHHLSMWLRAFRKPKWTLFIADQILVILVLYRRLVWKLDPDNSSDDINLILALRVYKRVQPTIWIGLALKLYPYQNALEGYFKDKSPLGNLMLGLYNLEKSTNG